MKLNTKSIAQILTIIPMSLFSIATFAQSENLVQNGSFESLSGKARKLGAIEVATGWSSPTGVRADLFTPIAKVDDIGTPANIYGSEEPKDGQNYAGIVAYSYNDKMPRTYLMTKLNAPMKKGMTYCISFNVALSELSKYAVAEIGAHASKKAFGTDEKSSIIDKTHIKHQRGKVFNAMYGWDLICGSYVAEGGEKFITIGNFTNNKDIDAEKSKKPADVRGNQIIAAYYYIDDVSVTLLNDGEDCDCGTGEASIKEYSNTVYAKTVQLTDKMTIEQKVAAQTIYFGFGKSLIQPAGNTSMELILNMMKENPNTMLEIQGHADENEISEGAKNSVFADMDEKRIKKVKEFFIEKGIPENRIKTTTMADSSPNSEISDMDTDDLKMAKNQRVTFVLTKY